MNTRGTILIVEDTPADLELLVDILTAQGYQVLSAENGELALAAVAARPPDLILLDIQMPGLDGFEVCRQLKSRPESRGIPVMFISVSGESAERVGGLKLGAVDYITKPFQREELLARIQTHLELRRLRVRLEQQAAGLQQANEQLQTELAERKRAETALRISETRFRDVAENAGEWIWETDAEGRYTYASHRVETILGYRPEEVLLRHFYDSFHPDDRESLKAAALAGFAARQPFCGFINRNVHKNGQTVWLSTRGIPVLDDQGNLVGYLGADTDITESKQAEEIIRRERDFSQAALDSLPGLFYLFDDQGWFLRWNKDFEKVSGYSADELTRMTPLIFFDGTDKGRIADTIQRVLQTGGVTVEADFLSKDQTKTPYFFTGKLFHFEQKSCVMGVGIDITERKRPEAALRQSEELYRAVADSANDAIITANGAGNIVGWNRGAERAFGYTEAEILGQPLTRLMPHGYRDPHAEGMSRVGAAGARRVIGKTVELEGLRKDGSAFPVEISLAERQTDAGHFYTGILRDITERKELEAQMERLRTEHAVIWDSLGEGVHWIDVDGRIKYENPASAKMLGYEVSELIGKPAHATVHHTRADGSPYPQSECPIYATLRDGVVRRVTDEVFWRKDGSSFAVEYVCTPVYDQNGRSGGSVVIFTDITERRRMEKVQSCLSRLAYQLSLLSDAPPAARLVADAAQDLLGWDACFLRLRSPDLARVQTMFNMDTVEGRRVEVPASSEPAPLGPMEERVMRDGPQIILRSGESDGTPGLITFGNTGRRSASLLFVPLRHHGQHLGLFSIQSYRVGAYDRAALDLLQTLADHAAGALERIRAEQELENVHKQLLDASRQAGMAEVATNVLHNVGNVLNSVNISTTLIVQSVKQSKASHLARVVLLLQEHAHDLGEFITHDSRAKHVPAHLAQLSEHLLAEQAANVRELVSLRQNVEHIKEIVAMQQNYATFGGVKEMINVADLVEDSLRLNAGALSHHHVEVIREFEPVPPLNVEKHKILQILVNLLRNAKHACQDSERADKRLTVRVANGAGRIKVSVIDNGVGIPPENLTRIFNHGFTTRKGGHGFGLHSGALAAQEMGGSLTVHSDGPGQGASFTLELPCPTRENPHE